MILAQVYGRGYDLVKVAKAYMEDDEDVVIDGETGETIDEVWDWIFDRHQTITFDKGELV